MKKWTTVILLLFLATIVGTGIWYFFQKDYHPALKDVQKEVEEDVQRESAEQDVAPAVTMVSEELPADNDWGVILTAEDVTPNGMKLVCTQSGGSPTGELSTGAWYELEKKVDDRWVSVEVFAEVCWEDIAWIIPAEGRTEWEVNWTWIYGTLESGEYRIAKELMDFRQTGDFDTCRSYAYFKIE